MRRERQGGFSFAAEALAIGGNETAGEAGDHVFGVSIEHCGRPPSVTRTGRPSMSESAALTEGSRIACAGLLLIG